MATVQNNRAATSRATLSALLIAAAAGTAHGLISLYWATGGDWLTSTLGRQLVDMFADKRWLLFPVAAVKIAFALLPPVLARLSWPARQAWRMLCWAGAAVLLVWGGVNTITGNLVLTGVIHPEGAYDRDGMVGHAWLWDPLFLIWGVALALALLLTRHRDV